MNTENKEEILEIIDQRPQKSSPSKYWAFAVVCVVAILTAGILFYRTSKGFQNSFDKMFRPNEYNVQIILNTIGELKKESKIVVLTAELTVDIERSSTKRFMWDYYDLGTTTVRMKVPGNKVQYFIHTDSLNAKSIIWDNEKQEYIFNLPDPVLDESIVEVQSDPSVIQIQKEIGWARLDSYSGKAMENQIRSELREKVIEAGKHELLLERAKKNAEQVILELIIKLKKEKEAGIFV